MRGKRAKWLKKLVLSKNVVLLLLIRNKYGESTQGMDYGQLLKKAKHLYKQGEIQKIKGWPSLNQLRNQLKQMKGDVQFDTPLTESGKAQQTL